jgi:hypothetical protein
MPAAGPPSRHAALLNKALPAARVQVAAARTAGATELDAVETVFAYAEQEARRALERQAAQYASNPNHSLRVTKAFAKHVRARAEAEKEEGDEGAMARTVRESLEEFISGDWMPPAPQRDPRGSNTEKIGLNVRVPKAIWDAANDLGKDPAAVQARGYKLTAASISIAALMEAYPLPKSKQDSTTA